MILDSYKVPGKNLKVSVSLQISKKDISGETSGTDTADAGTKAKELTCTFDASFKKVGLLKKFITVAQKKDAEKDQHKFMISDDLAEAMDIRQVTFVGDIRISESQGLQSWSVSFTLREYLSVAEKKEQREAPKKQEKAKEEGDKQGQSEQQPNLSTFEHLLSYVDWFLAPEEKEDKSEIA